MPDRTVVAVSDDRQSLVVLNPHPVERGDVRATFWSVLKWNGLFWEDEGFTQDSGQEDAHEVLREFLEGRE